MTTHNEERDVFQTHCFNPFPEPQTIPAGWDTSAILSAPTAASAQEAEDDTESDLVVG
jgi:hypothetical protein